MRTQIWLLILIAACGKDVAVTPDGSIPTGDGSGSNGGGGVTTVSGTIASDATWSGTIDLAGPTKVPSGVTVTVAAGATIIARQGSSIDIAGHVVVQGTKLQQVEMRPAASAANWLGFTVSGGTLEMHYANEISGGIVVFGGSATVMDSVLSHFHNVQDYLIMYSGMIDVEYSSFEPRASTTDLIHCDMHANTGGALTIKVVHSNLSGATFAFDFYGGTADLTYNNWFSNDTHLYTEAGSPVSGDVSFGWFEGTPPTAAPGSTITKNNLSSSKLTDAGPRL